MHNMARRHEALDARLSHEYKAKIIYNRSFELITDNMEMPVCFVFPYFRPASRIYAYDLCWCIRIDQPVGTF